MIANGDGTFTAEFSYNNHNLASTTIPVGEQNRFNPAPEDRGQPTTFEPGQAEPWPRNPLAVVFDGNPIVWSLDGLSVAASRSTQPCMYDVRILMRWENKGGQAIQPPSEVSTEVSVTSVFSSADCEASPDEDCTYTNHPPASGTTAMQVPANSSYSVALSKTPPGVRTKAGFGNFTVPGAGCQIRPECLHLVTLVYDPTPTTTTTTASTTSTEKPFTTTTAATTTAASTTTTASPTTSASPTTTASASTTSASQPATSGSTAAPTSATSTVAPTTFTGDVTNETGITVILRNDTKDTLDFVVACDGVELPATLAKFTLVPGQSLVISDAQRGLFCTAHVAKRDGGSAIITSENGPIIVAGETAERWAYAGGWLCNDLEVFVARDVSSEEISVAAPPGARPSSICDSPLQIGKSQSTFPWPLVVLGTFFAGLFGFALWRVWRHVDFPIA